MKEAVGVGGRDEGKKGGGEGVLSGDPIFMKQIKRMRRYSRIASILYTCGGTAGPLYIVLSSEFFEVVLSLSNALNTCTYITFHTTLTTIAGC